MFEGESRWREAVEIDRVQHQLPSASQQQQQLATAVHQVLLAPAPDATSEDHDQIKAPKKRAETWVQDEIKALIAYRKEMDSMFNTSKSNKHLWEQISQKMKERGYDRTPTMCTDKWRNLLKEYKKAKVQDKGTSKVACFKDLEELLSERAKSLPYRNPAKLDALQQGSARMLNVERQLDRNGHPTAALPSADAVGGPPPTFITNGGVPQTWSWRDTNANGGDCQLSGGKVVAVKFGDMTRRIRVDGPFKSINESVKTSFGLRTRRPFWLEDDEGVIQPLSRDMPPGQYSLNLDPGFTVKVCLYDDDGRMTGSTENRTLYTDEDLHEFLSRRGWSGLREVGSFRDFNSLEDLRPGAVYQRPP
ncbi:hypothetical protein BDL97_08G006300 [Sphagnum fallax]|nr:hypothetical protein BDL97_08G006300 [Sphagnum fallax]